MNEDLGTKLFGAIYMIQAVVPSMKTNKKGSIVNITTPGGKASGANTVPTSVSEQQEYHSQKPFLKNCVNLILG